MVNTKRRREFVEAWHSTEEAINKHIDLDAAYQPLRSKALLQQRIQSEITGPTNSRP